MLKPVIVLDGRRCDSLESFWQEVRRALEPHAPDAGFVHGLDGLNSVLWGVGDCTLRWEHSQQASRALGAVETVRYWQELSPDVHPENLHEVMGLQLTAHQEHGETFFDQVVAVLRAHASHIALQFV